MRLSQIFSPPEDDGYTEAMGKPFYHLAQVNIGRMRYPLDHPEMAGFANQLDPINALADASPGFVWRLQSESGNATDIRSFEDPSILVNMSVWDSVESLKEYVYRSRHIHVLRDRKLWFEKMDSPHMAMWWVPAGHIPSPQEARQRLDHLARHGESPAAFLFANPFASPDTPAESAGGPGPVSYDGRVLITRSNSSNGDSSGETIFRYRQDGARVWATYSGGAVAFGALIASAGPGSALDMRYHHVTTHGDWRTGRCVSTPLLDLHGRLTLDERWQWTNGDQSAGACVLEEIPSGELVSA